MNESRFFGMSLRGILAFMIIMTACVMSYVGHKIEEPLYSLVMFVAGLYFGQKSNLQVKP